MGGDVELLQGFLGRLVGIDQDLNQYLIKDDSVTEITYPVIQYPSKISNKNSLSFQKESLIEGKLFL